MKSSRVIIGLLTLALLAAPAYAAVEGRVVGKTPIPGDALDLAVSADGRYQFVLLKKGKVLVLASDGRSMGTVKVPAGTEQIAAAPQGDRLYVSGAGGSLQTVALDYIYDIDTVGSPFKGPADAPVEIVVFDDFQCPYCAQMVPVFDQVAGLYPKRVKIVFKNFPLPNHKFAGKAAMAALAAGEQGAFWPLHDKLFANQRQLSDKKIRQLATEVGLDMERFEKDLRDRALVDRVNSDLTAGQQAGVRGTPSVFVNGRLVRARTLQDLRAVIERELGPAGAGSR